MTDQPTIQDRLIALANEALTRTQDGAMRWKETDDAEQFVYSGTRTALTIDRYPDDNHFEFRVLNERGTVVESVSRWDGPDPEGDPWEKPTPAYKVLRDLHDAARRSALQIDAVISAAFHDLDNPEEKAPF